MEECLTRLTFDEKTDEIQFSYFAGHHFKKIKNRPDNAMKCTKCGLELDGFNLGLIKKFMDKEGKCLA